MLMSRNIDAVRHGVAGSPDVADILHKNQCAMCRASVINPKMKPAATIMMATTKCHIRRPRMVLSWDCRLRSPMAAQRMVLNAWRTPFSPGFS